MFVICTQTTRTYDYAYKKVGTYYLTANVSNKYAFGIYSRKIVVALQISNMGVVTKVSLLINDDVFRIIVFDVIVFETTDYGNNYKSYNFNVKTFLML